MNPNLLDQVRTATAQSSLLRAVASVRHDRGRALALGEVPLRPLNDQEIAGLEQLGNTADDWRRIRVVEGFDWRRVRQSSFHGDVLLGRFTQPVVFKARLRLDSPLIQRAICGSPTMSPPGH